MLTRLSKIANRTGTWLLIALVLIAGQLLPWAQHKTAALTQSAHDLAASARFTPGAGVFRAELFNLPLWCAALTLAMLTARAPRFGIRWLGLAGLALLAAQFSMPEYPKYFDAPYRVQLLLTVLMIALTAIVSLVGTHLPKGQGMTTGALIAFALANAAALYGCVLVKPHIEALYRDTVSLGAGWWLTLVATTIGCLALLLRVKNWHNAR